MTDRIQELLDHAADRLSAGAVVPPPPSTRRAPVWASVAAAAASVVLVAAAAVGLTGFVAGRDSPDQAAPGAGPACPDAYELLRQGAEPQPRIAPAPSDATAVVVCAQTGAPDLRLQPEPLAAVTGRDAVARLVNAVNSAGPVGNTRACGRRAPSQTLVFLHPGGQQAYAVLSTPSCSFLSDGLISAAVPTEVAKLLPSKPPPVPTERADGMRFEVVPDGTLVLGDPVLGDGLLECLDLPAVEDSVERLSTPASYLVELNSSDVDAFRACVDDVPGYRVVPTDEVLPQPTCDVKPAAETVSGYVGLTEAAAKERAERLDVTIRTYCRDGEYLDLTSDFRPERVNIAVENDRVIGAVAG